MNDPLNEPTGANDDAALGQVLRQNADRFRASADLRQRIERSVRDDSARHISLATASSAMSTRAPRKLRWGGFGAAFACGIALGIGLHLLPLFQSLTGVDEHSLRAELVASHLRSMMATHLTDIASSERHTVKPWFSGKLDYAPPVFDLADAGFPLQGGRLDYIGKRRVAALVYGAGQHTVNVFIWPDAGEAHELLAIDGFNLAHRSVGGMQIWGVSDMERAQLDQLIALIAERAQRSGTDAP